MKLIRIGAVWCPACLIMRPKLDEISKMYPHIEHIEYDYDFDEDLVLKYNVGTKLPVFILEDDKELIRIVGEKTKEEIIEILEKYI